MKCYLHIRYILLPLIILSGCSLQGTYIADQYLPFEQNNLQEEEVAARIIYIGDAGEPSAEKREPLLDAVERQAKLLPDKTFLFFLGDNIYPDGLPEKEDTERPEYERRLNEQVSIITNSGTRGVFIAGNHDWDQGRRNGWNTLKHQVQYFEKLNNPDVVFLPHEGCPGPEASDFLDNTRIIFMDTQWWLQKYDKPDEGNSDCYPVTEEKILERLDSLIASAGNRFIILAMHHPLETYGPHGGYFDWKAHIFPLTELNEYLWLPLPIVGSLYPIARMNGVSRQDISSAAYQHMKSKIEGVISKYSGILIASGHEHSLQLIKGINGNLYSISGFGTSVHASNTLSTGENSIFAGFYPGFMQVDIMTDGKAVLKVYKADAEYGTSIEEFSMKLN